MAQNQCSAYDSRTEWLESPHENYSICYTAEYADDVPFVEKWIDHAEALLLDKYGADLRNAKGRTRLHVNVMLLPYSNDQANTGRAGFYCCQDSSGREAWRSGVYSQMPYLTPSHHEWSARPTWGKMGLPPDDYHAKILVHEFFHAGQRAMWGSVDQRPVPQWVAEGLADYEGTFNSTEYNRTASFNSLVRYVHDRIPDTLYCCQTADSTLPTFGSTDIYFGGALILKYLADAFGEDIHVRLTRLQYPSFEEALVAELEAEGTTVQETFSGLQAWLEQQYANPVDEAVSTSKPRSVPTPTPVPAPAGFRATEQRITLSSGGYHTCALQPNGSAVCWGNDDAGQASPPPGERFISISSGEEHTCALRSDGSAVCWGNNGSGQASPPQSVSLAAVSSGNLHTCGLKDDGTPVCWGATANNQGDFPPGERFSSLDSGRWHVCALRPDGSPVCWGTDTSGQAAAPRGERLSAVSGGRYHGCALREDGSAVCWGNNNHGQTSPPQGERFTSISSGERHACALRPDGTAVCWGNSGSGRTVPPSGERFVAISSGYEHTCGLRQDGSVVCWGSNARGQASPPEGERFAVGEVAVG